MRNRYGTGLFTFWNPLTWNLKTLRKFGCLRELFCVLALFVGSVGGVVYTLVDGLFFLRPGVKPIMRTAVRPIVNLIAKRASFAIVSAGVTHTMYVSGKKSSCARCLCTPFCALLVNFQVSAGIRGIVASCLLQRALGSQMLHHLALACLLTISYTLEFGARITYYDILLSNYAATP